MRRTRGLVAAAVALLAVTLAGCTATVSLDAAPHANDPDCAEIMVRLPGDVDGAARVWTDAQSTAAWGTPTKLIMACGVTPPGPTTLKCITLGGVDWVVDESKQPNYRVTTFGRTPAVQVFVDGGAGGVDPNAALSAIGRLVAQHTKSSAHCSTPVTAPVAPAS